MPENVVILKNQCVFEVIIESKRKGKSIGLDTLANNILKS